MQVKFRGKRFGECARAGVPGVNERAVNVEENEPNHAARKIAGRGPGASFLVALASGL
jgi:hypothetical protein